MYHIIRDVENVARAHGVRRVSSVTLLLGEVSGVVPDLLLDAWRWAADKAYRAGAELIVEPVEAVTHCEACGRDHATVEHGKTCPIAVAARHTCCRAGGHDQTDRDPDEDPADAAPTVLPTPRRRRRRQPPPHRLGSYKLR
ncbi:MAG: hydrogenase maturation nickel metallochaperone HypA [Collinsella sp.]